MEADFSGWATVAGLKCSDGRTIKAEAFKHMDKVKVPLVWQHGHSDAKNVMGYAILEHREKGVYAYGFFNDTPQGKNGKLLVQHGDIDKLSIYANQLKEAGKTVLHGMIREVSLVLSGANPGAKIDMVSIRHSGGDIVDLDDEAVIHTGLLLEENPEGYEEETETVVEHSDDKTVKEIYDSMSPDQKGVLHLMVGAALEGKTAEHSDLKEAEKEDDKSGESAEKEGTGEVRHNIFESNGETNKTSEGATLTHAEIADHRTGLLTLAKTPGHTLQSAAKAYALQHGITDIDILFPDAQVLNNRPEWNKRRTEWVASVINGTHKSPFARVKSIVADITQEAARALGYIKGHYKKEEWFGLTKRVTTPTTVIKKQKLDRDDIIDAANFDVVPWMKGEMRLMLEEELARAILLGDGRDPESEDKIKDPGAASEGAGIRAIINENELYMTTVYVNLSDANSSYQEVIDSVLLARVYYKGSGSPTFYTTERTIVMMMMLKDTTGRKLYANLQDLAATLMVSAIVAVEPMEQYPDIVGVIVNLDDYNVGTDRGGEVTMFDDFDIDYNQYKYLIETRLSGALTKIKSAMTIKKVLVGDVLVDPVTVPTFVSSTGVVTIPTQTGVVYKNAQSSATLSAGAQSALTAGSTLKVKAVPASGYFFATNAADDGWSYTRPAA